SNETSTRTRIETRSVSEFPNIVVLRTKHPREQGLKPPMRLYESVISYLRTKHPREQGLKHDNNRPARGVEGLRTKHPREQGLKLKILTREHAINHASNETSTRTRIETPRDPVMEDDTD